MNKTKQFTICFYLVLYQLQLWGGVWGQATNSLELVLGQKHFVQQHSLTMQRAKHYKIPLIKL